MSLISISNASSTFPVYKFEQNLPLNGAWTLDLEVQDINNSISAGSNVNVSVNEAGGLSFSGTIADKRSGQFLNTNYCRVVGGKNGLTKIPKQRQFAKALTKDVITYLLQSAGETLSTTSNYNNTSLTFYTINGEDNISNQLTKLLQTIGNNIHWRFLPDGTLFIGTETWPAISTDGYTFEVSDPKNQYYKCGVPYPTMLPGYNLAGIGNISRVVHKISQDSGSTEIFAEIEQRRGIKESVISIVNSAFNFNYLGHYPCKVISQKDNLVDIKPLNTNFPSLQNVQLLSGNLEDISGQQVILFWEGGDCNQAYAYTYWANQPTAQFVALSNKVDDNFSSLKALFDPATGHSHTYLPGPGVPTTTTAITGAFIPESTAAKKIKAV